MSTRGSLPTGTTTVESNDAGGLFADNEYQLEEPCPLAQRRLNPMTREDSSLTTNVNILDGKPDDPVKTTLAIVPPSLLNQWMTEMVSMRKEIVLVESLGITPALVLHLAGLAGQSHGITDG